MQGYASREAALNILLEQETTGAFLKDLFGPHTDALPKPDRGLVREITLGVIRNLSLLDHNIGLYASRQPGPGAIRCILRLTAYQILFMDVPDFAAVNVGVELAKRRGDKFQGGFVNAVLKKLTAAGLQKAPGGSVKSLAVNFSHPEWLIRRWYKRLGGDGLLRALERNNQEAPLWIRVNPSRGTVDQARGALAELGVEFASAESDADAGDAPFLRVSGRGGGEKALHSDLFRDGRIAFQDPAAWLIAELAEWNPRESLLDLCSAPGGKAACLVERASLLGADSSTPDPTAQTPAAETPIPGAPIVCNDISFRRLRLIRDARERLGHTRLSPLVMDPTRSALRRKFDLIVVDAPCSNLGVLRRRPEARWSRTQEDLARLAHLQVGLLAAAAKLAGPAGRIVYATCSPEVEETSDVVAAFLAAHPGWQVADAGSWLPSWAVKEGFLWLFPGETEYDGFFAARLERK